jgi:DNA-binding IclR family transcriptional regulator
MDTPAQLLQRRTGLALSACYRAVHRAYDDGLVATGASDDRYALTEAGTALLLMEDDQALL